MFKAMSLFILGIAATGSAAAQQDLAFTGDFESGQIRKSDQTRDGFYVRTLPENQIGSDSISTGAGGFGPGANSDTKVVPSDEIGAETVRPRNGTYFARSALYYNKNYLGLNTGIDIDKPRSSLSLSDPVHQFDYDVEGYLGFSIYVPLNYEDETGTVGDRGAVELLAIKEPQDASRYFVVLQHYVPKGSTKARWFFRYGTGANSTEQSGAELTSIDLGPVDSDRGKWTDFVIRFRENPFAVDTNPNARGIPNSKNQNYEGNKGILQVWKAEGPVDGQGNRKMVLKIDEVNKPIGLVPHATEKRTANFRIYKYGWKRNPTDVRGPVWYGFDEIRLGFARQGIGYSDVDPSGATCSDDCAPAADVKPKPPASLDVM